MDSSRGRTEDLLDVARVLLLVQGAILVATTIEALFFSLVFPGGGGAVLLSGVAAVVILVARIRLRADRRWARRLVYVVEGLILAAMAIDVVLALVLTHALPPVVALSTQVVLPVSVIELLRRSRQAAVGSVPPHAAAAFGGVS
jgi:hypothetical protein